MLPGPKTLKNSSCYIVSLSIMIYSSKWRPWHRLSKMVKYVSFGCNLTSQRDDLWRALANSLQKRRPKFKDLFSGLSFVRSLLTKVWSYCMQMKDNCPYFLMVLFIFIFSTYFWGNWDKYGEFFRRESALRKKIIKPPKNMNTELKSRQATYNCHI